MATLQVPVGDDVFEVTTDPFRRSYVFECSLDGNVGYIALSLRGRAAPTVTIGGGTFLDVTKQIPGEKLRLLGEELLKQVETLIPKVPRTGD